MYRKRRLDACTSENGAICRTVKVCDRVDLSVGVHFYTFLKRLQRKRTTCDCRQGEVGLLRTIVQWKCVSCFTLMVPFAQRSCDEQY